MMFYMCFLKYILSIIVLDIHPAIESFPVAIELQVLFDQNLLCRTSLQWLLVLLLRVD